MQMHATKKDLKYLLLYVLLFILITQEGIIKYLILTAGIMYTFMSRKRTSAKYYGLLLHAIVYSVLGLALAIVSSNVSYESIKQILIYLCSGLFAISMFHLYGKDDTKRLLDLQLIGLCIAYVIMYARYFTLEAFYYESCHYAYIFGVYGILYFCQRRYIMMALSVLFMVFDHKRITNGAFVAVLLVVIIIRQTRSEKVRKAIDRAASAAMVIVPILWVYFGSNGTLVTIFARLGINTLGRVEGTGAWNIAREYYSFMPLYVGKGIGWVLNWLGTAVVPGFSNLHNDFLTAFIELGFIGFIVWLISFLIIPRRLKSENRSLSNLINVLIGFMFINMLTDNIYIYVTFLFPFYVVLLSILFGEDNHLYLDARKVK